MPPHYNIIAIRQRSLVNILDDLKEARRDLIDATADGHEDRATEADARFQDLQAEFDVRLAEATGLGVEGFRSAYAEALI